MTLNSNQTGPDNPIVIPAGCDAQVRSLGIASISGNANNYASDGRIPSLTLYGTLQTPSNNASATAITVGSAAGGFGLMRIEEGAMITNANLTIGDYGIGIVTNNGGNLFFTPGADRNLTVGGNASGFGTFVQNSGLTKGKMHIGIGLGGTGTVEVAGARLRGLPTVPFGLGPRGSGPAVFDCVLAPEDGGGAETALELAGVFGGRRSSRFCAPLLLERRFLAELERVPVEWRSAGAWKRNTSAQTYGAAFDDAGQAMRFDFGWTDPSVDRWFYPVHELSLPQEGLEGARMMEFEVKSAQDKVENDFAGQYLMLVHADGSKEAKMLPYNAPVGKWERR